MLSNKSLTGNSSSQVQDPLISDVPVISAAKSSQSRSEVAISAPRHLLPNVVAQTVSKLTSASRFSLQCASLTAQATFFVMRHGTRASIGSAKLLTENMIYFISEFEKKLMGRREDNEASRMETIRNLFSFAEWLAIGAIHQSEHFTSSSLNLMNLSLRFMDGLFGATDTSESLCGFVRLLSNELRDSHDPHLKSITSIGFSGIWKAAMAWHIIQMQTNERREGEIDANWSLSLIAAPDDNYVMRMENTNDDIAGIKEVFEAATNESNANSDTETPASNSRASNYNEMEEGNVVPSEEDRLIPFNREIFVNNSAETLDSIIPNPWRPMDAHRPSIELIQLLSKYVKYASAVYGKKFLRLFGLAKFSSNFSRNHGFLDSQGHVHSSNHWVFSQHTGLPLTDILVSTQHRPNKKYCQRIVPSLKSSQMELPEYVLSVDHQEKHVCLTIRGTFSLSDTLTNLSCLYSTVYVDGKQHRIHSGMLQQALSLSTDPELQADLAAALQRWPEYGLTLIGHSLGSGIASVLGLLWSQYEVEVPEPILQEWPRFQHLEDPTLDSTPWRPANPSIPEWKTGARFGIIENRCLRVFAFGPPCSMSYELGRMTSRFITSLTHGCDFVSSLSFGSVRDLFKAASLLSESSENASSASLISDEVLNHVLYGRSGVATNTDSRGSNPTPNSRHDTPPPSPLTKPANSADKKSSTQLIQLSDTEWFHTIAESIRSRLTNEKMYPAGDLYWMHSHKLHVPSKEIGQLSINSHVLTESRGFGSASSGSEWVLTRRILISRVDNVRSLCGEMQISVAMLLDHLAGKYELGLKAVRDAIFAN